MNTWAVVGSVALLAVLLGAAFAVDHAAEGISAAALLGGIITTLNASLASGRQHRETLQHQTTGAQADRIAAVRSDDVARVRRWLREVIHGGIQATQYGMSVQLLAEREPRVADAVLRSAQELNERIGRVAVEDGAFDALIATLSSEELAQGLKALQFEENDFRELMDEMSVFARNRWSEQTDGAAAEARRLAEAFQEHRSRLIGTTRVVSRQLEAYAAVTDASHR